MQLPGWLIRQLGHPRGTFGRVLVAALNRGNLPLNLHMIGALELPPRAEVLEIGFGGGVGLDLLLRHAPEARVTGVEHAADMVALARKRFADDLARGRLVLAEASVQALPFPDGAFDGACSANCVYFWPDVDAGLRELARVLRPEASLIIAINDPAMLVEVGFAAHGLNTLDPEELAARMRTNGFADARARRMPDPSRHGTSLVYGRRSAI